MNVTAAQPGERSVNVSQAPQITATRNRIAEILIVLLFPVSAILNPGMVH